jgi:hypothetical protein
MITNRQMIAWTRWFVMQPNPNWPEETIYAQRVALDPKQIVSFNELLMSQVVTQEALIDYW